MNVKEVIPEGYAEEGNVARDFLTAAPALANGCAFAMRITRVIKTQRNAVVYASERAQLVTFAVTGCCASLAVGTAIAAFAEWSIFYLCFLPFLFFAPFVCRRYYGSRTYSLQTEDQILKEIHEALMESHIDLHMIWSDISGYVMEGITDVLPDDNTLWFGVGALAWAFGLDWGVTNVAVYLLRETQANVTGARFNKWSGYLLGFAIVLGTIIRYVRRRPQPASIMAMPILGQDTTRETLNASIMTQLGNIQREMSLRDAKHAEEVNSLRAELSRSQAPAPLAANFVAGPVLQPECAACPAPVAPPPPPPTPTANAPKKAKVAKEGAAAEMVTLPKECPPVRVIQGQMRGLAFNCQGISYTAAHVAGNDGWDDYKSLGPDVDIAMHALTEQEKAKWPTTRASGAPTVHCYQMTTGGREPGPDGKIELQGTFVSDIKKYKTVKGRDGVEYTYISYLSNTVKGDSGGPIFNANHRPIGVHVGYDEALKRNIGVLLPGVVLSN